IWMLASTNCFVNGPELPFVPLVVTVWMNDEPTSWMVTGAEALTTVVPAVAGTMLDEQGPATPGAHLLPPTKGPGPLVIVAVTVTPLAGAKPNPVVVSFFSTKYVIACGWPTSFTADDGPVMRASHTENFPSTKSFSSASTDCDVRVSPRKLLKQP